MRPEFASQNCAVRRESKSWPLEGATIATLALRGAAAGRANQNGGASHSPHGKRVSLLRLRDVTLASVAPHSSRLSFRRSRESLRLPHPSLGGPSWMPTGRR